MRTPMRKRYVPIILALMTCAFYAGTQAKDIQDITEKQYRAWIYTKEQVSDGDTLTDAKVYVAALSERGEVWPGIYLVDNGVLVKTDIRLAGIDTPELRPEKTWPDGTPRTEASRDTEKRRALEAQDMLAYFIGDTAQYGFILKKPVLGKYAGRVVAEVWIEPKANFEPGTPLNVSEMLLQLGMAKPYDGTGARARWD